MIEIGNVIPQLMKRLPKLDIGCYLEVRSYKRDRGLLIVRMEEDDYEIIEDGFSKQSHHSGIEKMSKVLKSIIKREFPRSKKLRIYEMGPYRSENIKSLGRKKI